VCFDWFGGVNGGSGDGDGARGGCGWRRAAVQADSAAGVVGEPGAGSTGKSRWLPAYSPGCLIWLRERWWLWDFVCVFFRIATVVCSQCGAMEARGA
jgi:hypothetical protein